MTEQAISKVTDQRTLPPKAQGVGTKTLCARGARHASRDTLGPSRAAVRFIAIIRGETVLDVLQSLDAIRAAIARGRYHGTGCGMVRGKYRLLRQCDQPDRETYFQRAADVASRELARLGLDSH